MKELTKLVERIRLYIYQLSDRLFYWIDGFYPEKEQGIEPEPEPEPDKETRALVEWYESIAERRESRLYEIRQICAEMMQDAQEQHCQDLDEIYNKAVAKGLLEPGQSLSDLLRR
jgi:hypothetical protein